MGTFKSYYLTHSHVMELGKQNKVELVNAYNSLERKPDEVKGYEVVNGKAIVSVDGILVPSCSEWEEYWGYRSMAKIEKCLVTAMEDFTVNHVILDMDSPGGTVQATKPLADFIKSMRGDKRITTFIRGQMCSGGVFIGTAADEIFSDSETNIVGSIGVYMVHYDYSEWEANLGVKATYIKAGRYKAAGNPDEPLSDDAKEMYQKLVDNDYRVFVESVADYRGVTVEEVVQNWADAKLFSASEAVSNGLIDGIVSFNELIND